jgi:Tfp pilus assembly protein PilN
VRAVNLLPREETPRSFEAHRGVVFGAVGGTALATALLVSLVLGAGGSVNTKRSELESLEAQIAALPPAPAQDTSEEDVLAAEKGARVAALSAALSGRVAWDRVLRQISLVLPEDVWLTTLAAVAPGGSSAAAGTGLTMSGSTYSQNGVARLLARLSVVPDLANVRLQMSQVQEQNDRDLVQFTILADIRAQGTAAAPVATAAPPPAGAAS